MTNMIMKTKSMAAKAAAGINAVMLTMICMANNAMAETTAAAGASTTDWANVTGPVTKLCSDLRAPAMTVVGAIGALYCILLGVKYSKAEEPQDQMKAKNHLKNALVGFIMIFILLAAFPSLLTALGKYAKLTI